MIYIDDHLDELKLDEALLEISEQRRQQALRIRHEQGQRECVAAYLLLKRALHEQFGMDGNPELVYGKQALREQPEKGASQKPRIAGRADIHFNLSHCKTAVACAVDVRPVGIDIESIRPFKESLARYTMNEQELQVIMDSERPDVEFIRLWTMKEALLKLSGEGISTQMRNVLCGEQKHFSTIVNLERQYVCTLCTNE